MSGLGGVNDTNEVDTQARVMPKWLSLALAFNLLWMILSSTVPFLRKFTTDNALYFVVPSVVSIGLYFLYLRQRLGSLSSSEVDSVYYLGFLITLMSLGAAGYQLGFEQGDGAQKAIAAKFAVGLLVTGLGLFFRMILQQENKTSNDLTEELDEYARSISSLNDRIGESAKKIKETVEDILEISRNSAKMAGAETLSVITKELTPVSDDLRKVITDINRAFGRFKEGKFDDLSGAVDELTVKLKEMDVTASELKLNLGALSSGSVQLATAQSSVAGEFKEISTSIRQAEASAMQFSQSAAKSATELGNFSTNASAAVVTLGEFGATAEKISLNQLTVQIGALTSAFELLTKNRAVSVEEFAKLSRDFGDAQSQTIAGMQAQADALGRAAQSLGIAMTALAVSIKKAADRAVEEAKGVSSEAFHE